MMRRSIFPWMSSFTTVKVFFNDLLVKQLMKLHSTLKGFYGVCADPARLQRMILIFGSSKKETLCFESWDWIFPSMSEAILFSTVVLWLESPCMNWLPHSYRGKCFWHNPFRVKVSWNQPSRGAKIASSFIPMQWM